jgi:hypothetical protein
MSWKTVLLCHLPQVPMKPSPSATYSNLVQLSGLLCYAHTRQVNMLLLNNGVHILTCLLGFILASQACITDPASAVTGQPLSVRKVSAPMAQQHQNVSPLPCFTWQGQPPGCVATCGQVESQYTDYVHCIKAMPHGATGYLLVCTEAGVQVCARTAGKVLRFVNAATPY